MVHSFNTIRTLFCIFFAIIFKILEIVFFFILNCKIGMWWFWIPSVFLRVFFEIIDSGNESLFIFNFNRIRVSIRSIFNFLQLKLPCTVIRIITSFLAGVCVCFFRAICPTHLKFFLLNLNGVLLSLELSHIVNQLRKILSLVLTHSWRCKDSGRLKFLCSNWIVDSVIERNRVGVLFSWSDDFLFDNFVLKIGFWIIITLSNLFFAVVLLLIRVIALNLIRLKILLRVLSIFFTNICLLRPIVIFILSLLVVLRLIILFNKYLIRIKWMLLEVLLLSISWSLIIKLPSFVLVVLLVTLKIILMLRVWTWLMRSTWVLVLFVIWFLVFLNFIIC